MCGIAGSIGSGVPSAARRLQTLAVMQHRGPDGAGEWVTSPGSVVDICLLHRRLAIIDPDPRANQPFVADGCVLIFNGEIYNHVELRRQLSALGHTFSTASDTEVIVKAWREWGVGCFDMFEGMWAFALYDERQASLVLSRDPLGEKPLFLRRIGNRLYFASEAKALAALSGQGFSPDGEQVRRFLVNDYRTLYKQRRTWLEGMEEFPAASYAVLADRELIITPRRYWDIRYQPQAMSEAEAIDGVRVRLENALRLRLRADVPVAFCLSGGIDSGALAALAVKRFGQSVHAFSIIDRDPRYDESDNIDRVVADLKCRDTRIQLDSRDFFPRLERLVERHDAPISTISYYIHAQLSEAISAAGYKVSLSGTGADELLTGYHDHYLYWLAGMHGSASFSQLQKEWKDGYGSTVRNPLLKDPLVFVKRPDERGHILLDRDSIQACMVVPFEERFEEHPYADDLLRRRMLNELLHEIVPVLLKEDDLNSMTYSVENRSPYLDRELMRFAYSVPTHLLIKNGCAKWLLRSAMAEYLPDAVRLDRRKRGFNASIETLVDCGDDDVVDRLLAPGPIFDVVDRENFLRLLQNGDFSSNSLSKFLFRFISARVFLESPLVRGAANQKAPAARDLPGMVS